MSWQQSLKNKTVLITGASSGIGAAAARKFASEGANLILLARRLDRLEALSAELEKQYHIKCLPIKCDVTKLAEVQSLEKILQKNPVDILLNNAGLAVGTEKIQDADPADWELMIDTNVKGLLYLTRLVLPKMIERDSGHIINIGSIAGHGIYEGGAVYCASKTAVDVITRSLRLDLFGTQVRVSEVSPGLIETEFSLVRYKGDAVKAKNLYDYTIPLTVEDIAEIIIYCASAPPHVNISEVVVWPTLQAGIGKVAAKKQ
ncbi:MAG: SDR family NAD(P)-dependent oxidoreductase [Gammaproteobacteria bacterium]|nr:SDR family NAD(P)-dependent oxidoreductase [Gammaproteobacteria bacterium]